MAKKLQSFDPAPDDQAQIGVDAEEQQWRDAERALDTRHRARQSLPPVKLSIDIELSPAVVTFGYAPAHIDNLYLNTSTQRTIVKTLTESLDARREELLDGTRITRPHHAVQWLLEQMAIAMDSTVLDDLVAGMQ